MILTEAQREEFQAVTEPLIKWMNDNCHPHCHVYVDNTYAELAEGVSFFRTEKYWKD